MPARESLTSPVRTSAVTTSALINPSRSRVHVAFNPATTESPSASTNSSSSTVDDHVATSASPDGAQRNSVRPVASVCRVAGCPTTPSPGTIQRYASGADCCAVTTALTVTASGPPAALFLTITSDTGSDSRSPPPPSFRLPTRNSNAITPPTSSTPAITAASAPGRLNHGSSGSC